MTRTLLAATVLALALLGALAAAAAPHADARPSTGGPWVVRDLGQGRAVVAGHRTDVGRQTLRQLIRRWGRPARIGRPGGAGRSNYCVARWSRPRARVDLANFGSGHPCNPRFGKIQSIETVGPAWRTDRGLAVGADELEIEGLYPEAFIDHDYTGPGQVWILRPYERVCIGDCGGPTFTTSAILALTDGVAVRRFVAWVGAAGD